MKSVLGVILAAAVGVSFEPAADGGDRLTSVTSGDSAPGPRAELDCRMPVVRGSGTGDSMPVLRHAPGTFAGWMPVIAPGCRNSLWAPGK